MPGDWEVTVMMILPGSVPCPNSTTEREQQKRRICRSWTRNLPVDLWVCLARILTHTAQQQQQETGPARAFMQ